MGFKGRLCKLFTLPNHLGLKEQPPTGQRENRQSQVKKLPEPSGQVCPSQTYTHPIADSMESLTGPSRNSLTKELKAFPTEQGVQRKAT